MTVWEWLAVLGADVLVGLIVFGISQVFQAKPDTASRIEGAHD
jgi:hypothetical protein